MVPSRNSWVISGTVINWLNSPYLDPWILEDHPGWFQDGSPKDRFFFCPFQMAGKGEKSGMIFQVWVIAIPGCSRKLGSMCYFTPFISRWNNPLILTICKLPTGHSSRSPFVGPEALKTSGWIWPGTTWPVAKNPPRRSASRCLGGSTSGYT